MGRSDSGVSFLLKLVPISASLASMVALALLGMLSNFSFTATQAAEASNRGTVRPGAAEVDVGKLTEPLRTPSQATSAITGGNVTNTPEDPGAATRLTIPFTTGAGLPAGTGEIIVRLPDDDWAVPSTMDRSQITITASETTSANNVPSDAVVPQSVTLDLVGTENDLPEITLVIPDMVLGNSDEAIGNQGIAAGALVTVVFNQSAGIRNPTEGGFFDIIISTSAEPVPVSVPDAVFVPVLLELSSTGDPRGELITMVARGVVNGTTVTFFRDENGNQNRESAERVLCRAMASSADIAACDYAIANPPFDPGSGDGDCLFASLGTAAFDCNYINAFDGETNFITQRDQADLNNSIFELEPGLTASPDTASIGDTIVVSLFDYPGDTVALVTLGGVTITGTNLSPQTPAIDATTGQVNFTITVPGTVPLGVQQLIVGDNTGTDQDIRLTIGGAILKLSTNHTAIANQNLTISGSGFTQRRTGTIACVLQGDILFNSVPLIIDDDSLDDSCNDEYGGPGVELSSAGTFKMTVIVAQGQDSLPSRLLTEGVHELEIMDTSGASGVLNLAIPKRTLAVVPGTGKPGSTIIINGTAFPFANPAGAGVEVEVQYIGGPGCIQKVTGIPDTAGSLSVAITVPLCVSVPSTNQVIARLKVGGEDTGVVEVADHLATGPGVADADITVAKWPIHSIQVGPGPDSLVIDAASNRAYVSNRRGNTVSVIDTTTDTVLTDIPVGAAPDDLILDSSRARLFVAIRGSMTDPGNTVAIIDTNTNTMITNVTVGPAPDRIRFSDRLGRLYVPSRGGNSVSIIDADTTTDNLITPVTVGNNISQFRINPNTNLAYALNNGSGTVTIFDGATNTDNVITTVTVGNNPSSMRLLSSLNRVLVANEGDGTVSIIDGATAVDAVITTVTAGDSPEVKVEETTNQVYVLNHGDGTVSVIDGATNTDSVLATIPVGIEPTDILVDSASSRAYIANLGNNTVSVIDTDTNGLVTSIPVGLEPEEVQINKALRRLYVTSTGNSSVTIIDTVTNTVIDTLPTGTEPANVEIHPVDKRLYISNTGEDTVTVVQDTVLAGSDLVYTLTATNLGLEQSTGVVVSDTLPPGVIFNAGASSPSCIEQVPGEVSCVIGDLSSGAGSQLKIQVAVEGATLTGTLLTNTAAVAGNENDSNGQNDTATASTIVQASDLQAELSFVPHQDPVDGASGLKVSINRVFEPSGVNSPSILLGAFQAEITYDGACINIGDIRQMDFVITSLAIDNTDGTATFNGTNSGGVAPPADLGLVLTRQVGSATQSCSLDVQITSLRDVDGVAIGLLGPSVENFLRGDARADGVIDIADAMFIAQYLDGSRSPCTRQGDTSCLHLVNAASVHQNGRIDQSTIDDALFIVQYLTGLRDEFYNLLPSR